MRRYLNLNLAVLAALSIAAPCVAQVVIAQPTSPLQHAAGGVWPTQKECEAANGQSCAYNQCVGVVQGGNISVCDGGWQPKSTVEAQQPAQGQR